MTLRGAEQNIYLLGKVAKYGKYKNLFQYLDEINGSKLFLQEIEKKVENEPSFTTKKFNNVFDFRFFRILLYTLIRQNKPETIIETGVMHGLSSYFILKALEKNNVGKLISVDAPSFYETGPFNKDGFKETLPKNRKSGWIVPEPLHTSWDLRIGTSKEILPTIGLELDSLDMFIHDSDHSYENMIFELRFAWKKLKKCGIIICDNINTNEAFTDFCKEIQYEPVLLPAPDNEFNNEIRFGMIVK